MTPRVRAIAPMPIARARRGFTILEVVLASLISTLVLAASISLLFFINGTDRRMERRYKEVDNLQRIHLVMQRVSTSFVMADRASLPRNPGTATAVDGATTPGGTTPGGATSGTNDPKAPAAAPPSGRGERGGASGPSSSPSGRGSGSGSARDDQGGASADGRLQAPRVPPRILLTGDTRYALEASALAASVSGREDGANPRRMMTTPQRLEVALSASPVGMAGGVAEALGRTRRSATPAREASTEARSDRDRAQTPRLLQDVPTASLEGEEDEEKESAGARVIRGALELRPQRTRVRSDGGAEQVLWELWWVPLAPRREVGDDVPPPSPIGDAVRVASDISFLQWRFFDDRTRKTAYQAAFMQDIPAYIELEVETAGGQAANWLFEVNWAIGNEVPPENAPTGTTDGKDPKAADGRGATPSTPTGRNEKGGGGK